MNPVKTLCGRLARHTSIVRDERGVSAIEFGVLAPILLFALLTTVDIGFAVHERMAIDNALRAGAEAAMGDQGIGRVRTIVQTVAEDHFTVAPEGDGDDFSLSTTTPLSLEVDRFCACPEARGSAVDCSAGNCRDQARPYVYYKLQANKTYKAIILPSLSLDSTVQIQAQ
jgi:pilus assembly protein CpaE